MRSIIKTVSESFTSSTFLRCLGLAPSSRDHRYPSAVTSESQSFIRHPRIPRLPFAAAVPGGETRQTPRITRETGNPWRRELPRSLRHPARGFGIPLQRAADDVGDLLRGQWLVIHERLTLVGRPLDQRVLGPVAGEKDDLAA